MVALSRVTDRDQKMKVIKFSALYVYLVQFSMLIPNMYSVLFYDVPIKSYSRKLELATGCPYQGSLTVTKNSKSPNTVRCMCTLFSFLR